MNPCELQIELFCRGMRLDASCDAGPGGRPLARMRAGLGSGLDLVLPGRPPIGRDVWVNVPVVEEFAQRSPLRLRWGGCFEVVDDRSTARFPVRVPDEPSWYRRSTSRGVEMTRVGVLQGSYLGIYLLDRCRFWSGHASVACRFCTSGKNVGVTEALDKSVEDVVETARAAKEESGVTFVHLNSGFQGGGALRALEPYVRALKERVGALVGVQTCPEDPFEEYDRLIGLGVDHFSFCFEFRDPEVFARICPGKDAVFGQRRYLEALAWCQERMPKGSCSGEIIAGVEPIESTFQAIDDITSIGAFPTICIFRPLRGSAMEAEPPPEPEAMRRVMKRMWERCRDRGIPIGLAPNIEVSLVVQPTDAAYLGEGSLRDRWYFAKLGLLRGIARPLFRRRMRARAAGRA
jgi:biotin synthase-related radical SAM superfamily protein